MDYKSVNYCIITLTLFHGFPKSEVVNSNDLANHYGNVS